MAAFLELPTEIRNMIYRYCLVKNRTLIPYEEYYQLSKADLEFRKDLPTVALLQVCKIIETEAAEVLYGDNTWRVTSKDGSLDSSLLAKREINVWNRRPSIFKHIVLVFDQQDVDREELDKRTLQFHESGPDFKAYGEVSSLDNRSRFMHTQARSIMRHSWGQRFMMIYDMTHLASITFDLSRLFCHAGCCRKEPLVYLINEFLFTFYKFQRFVDPSLKVQLRGIRDEEWNEVLPIFVISPELAEQFTILHTEPDSVS